MSDFEEHFHISLWIVIIFLVLITATRGPNSRHNERQIKDEQ